MNNEMLELAKELKADALLTRRYQIAKCSVWSDQLIDLCEHVEKISQANEDSTKLIEAFCADDAEWHKLLDTVEQENSKLIRLVVKLADKCSEMKQELERINKLQPVAWMYPVFHDEKMQFTTDAIASENIDIHFQSHGSPLKVTPLYKLDK
ncbi:hypothetical protein I6L80_04580 [Providencia rettgeri]|uniref:Uncharacterized protein n=1 Tax=Providencia rettgeri TaxID=587 RepID=A0A379FLQ6_PRORE|nr:hypothetical protein [Providencia rettgeri]QXB06546.1 hypothetical protein I6L80_04580 [Providencia rettgeri]SUC29626.1 Uncharacterised protein [Providencia rettgeri]